MTAHLLRAALDDLGWASVGVQDPPRAAEARRGLGARGVAGDPRVAGHDHRITRRSVLALVGVTLLAACTGRTARAQDAPTGAPRVLVFTRTTGFRHDAIPADEHGFAVDATEDPVAFDDAALAPYAAVVFLLTTGDVLDADGRAAFERYVRAGHGYVGVHSATDTEYGWSWYGELVGARFAAHPAIQSAVVRVEDADHPSTAGMPDPWLRTDEWYDFRANPRGHVHVLLTVDEGSYHGGGMGADHPIAWYHAYDGGRAWYTAMGHTAESYRDPAFLSHLLGGIQWAAGLAG
jgi:cytochrome c